MLSVHTVSMERDTKHTALCYQKPSGMTMFATVLSPMIPTIRAPPVSGRHFGCFSL